MKKENCAKLVKIGLIDPKLPDPMFFEIDLNNIVPIIRQARIAYVSAFMAAGPFRREPRINIIFELPDGSYKYVHGWLNNNRLLELNKETIAQPEKLVFEILTAWNDCEKVWNQHIQIRKAEFERSRPKPEIPPAVILQFNKK